MNSPELIFFPVGNGDMTLIITENGNRILIDVNIRETDDEIMDVVKALKKKIETDNQGRPFIDAFLLSHPDEDHCRGLSKYFHLGDPADYSQDSGKIFIRQIWSSPMVFRRKSKTMTLCKDAEDFSKEARRRVSKYRDTSSNIGDGDRILILGEDKEGKTEDLAAILINNGDEFSEINGQKDSSFSALLLAPAPPSDDAEEEKLSKNNSSTIIRIKLGLHSKADACLFLTGGDAGVEIWEKLWLSLKDESSSLEYDILLSPHHCSWHSLSHDSWSKSKGQARVSKNALSALSQARSGADIIASSNKIEDNYNDPPCIGAKREYENIIASAQRDFHCTGDNPFEVLKFKITNDGPLKIGPVGGTSSGIGFGIGGGVAGNSALGKQPFRHGEK